MREKQIEQKLGQAVNPDEEVLEVDALSLRENAEQDSEERGNAGAESGEDAVSKRHYRR